MEQRPPQVYIPNLAPPLKSRPRYPSVCPPHLQVRPPQAVGRLVQERIDLEGAGDEPAAHPAEGGGEGGKSVELNVEGGQLHGQRLRQVLVQVDPILEGGQQRGDAALRRDDGDDDGEATERLACGYRWRGVELLELLGTWPGRRG